MKFSKLIIGVLLCLLISVGVIFGWKEANSVNDYYVQVKAPMSKAGEDNSHYVYNLKGFDKNGKEKLVTFFADKRYVEGTLLVVSRSFEGYTGDIRVVKANELPRKLQKNFNLEKAQALQ
ncbi:YxeA family protein [Priestia megaterium]|uniref:YxeA family protein n=1 Tax=Priestia megaterium TaxID=1404 RepID=UPI001FB45D82|nr:YxeA family protein [Priestia megaterium]